MGDATGIEWTDATWNPIRGCSAVSEGCRNCYAASVAARFNRVGMPYEGLARMTPQGPRWTGEVRFIEEHLQDPLKWRRPRRVFVNSMSDLFHEALPDLQVAAVFAVMAACHAKGLGHTFQVLTKRPERMAELLASEKFQATVNVEATALVNPLRLEQAPRELIPMPWPLPNVWLGTSVEDQGAANERIHHLAATPAQVRFLSCEPLLGPLDLSGTWSDGEDWEFSIAERIQWVIVGGESGRGARPMDLSWARSLRDQCQAAEVAFFVKQLGTVAATTTKKGGSIEELPEDLRIREFPQ